MSVRINMTNVGVLLVTVFSFISIAARADKTTEATNAITNAGATTQTKMANGLQTATFDTLNGRVIVHLPDDIRAGETISGTVVAEPKGDTGEERRNNAAKLTEFKLNFGSKSPRAEKELMIMVTPRLIISDDVEPVSQSPGNFTIKLPDTFNYTIGGTAPRTDPQTVTITINSPIWFINNQPTFPPATEAPPASSPFQLPWLGQQGRPLEIFGSFDGNSSNTILMYGPERSTVQDFEKNTENVSGGFGLIRPLAESPRKIVFEAPTNFAGPVQLHVQEGLAQATAAYRNVAVRLTAPKTSLMRGEKTTLTTEVSGLQGIIKPVPLTLEAKGVITMEGGMFQPLVIQPSQVTADGRYLTRREVTGVQAGVWEATSTVVTTPFNIVLRDPDPPQTVLINSFTGDYVFCGAGIRLSGTGQVQRAGCTITLTHDAPDRLVSARIDACKPVDNGRFFTFYTPGTTTDLVVTVTDTKPTRTRVYFNPLNRPAPPVQDVSAFATCP